jgi:DNA invertase Pin-like site-specific DNA recombinase
MTRKASLGKPHSRGSDPVWALLAVSSEHQADTLAHQKTWAQQTADTNGWRLTRIFGEDRKGVGSGKEGPRAIVREVEAELRSLAPESRPRRLLVIRLDRIGRGNIAESQMLLHNLNSLGVSVWTSDGEVKLDTSTEQLLNAFYLFGAQHENEIRAAKARWVYKRKRDAGQIIGNRRPYGLKLKEGKDVKDGKRGDAVREAFKLRAAGYGYFRIAKRLAAIAPPAVNQKGTEKVIQWGTSRMSLLLNNRAYVGVLIDEATFAKAQRVGKLLSTAERDRDVRRRWPWPLSGSIRCSCGLAMTGICTGKRSTRIRYYACRSHQNHNGRIRFIRADDLEQDFIELLGRLRASPELLKRYRTRAASPVSRTALEHSQRDLRAKATDIDRKRERVFDLYLSGDVRREDVQSKLDALAVERDDLAARIASVSEQIVVAKATGDRDRDADALLRRAAATFQKATEAEQRLIARAVAVELGGLHVDGDCRLKVGGPGPGLPKRGL